MTPSSRRANRKNAVTARSGASQADNRPAPGSPVWAYHRHAWRPGFLRKFGRKFAHVEIGAAFEAKKLVRRRVPLNCIRPRKETGGPTP